MGDIAEVLSAEDLVRPKKLQKKPAGYSIRLENVEFAYHTKKVLDSISMEIVPGTVTALVGPSGGGKIAYVSQDNYWSLTRAGSYSGEPMRS